MKSMFALLTTTLMISANAQAERTVFGAGTVGENAVTSTATSLDSASRLSDADRCIRDEIVNGPHSPPCGETFRLSQSYYEARTLELKSEKLAAREITTYSGSAGNVTVYEDFSMKIVEPNGNVRRVDKWGNPIPLQIKPMATPK